MKIINKRFLPAVLAGTVMLLCGCDNEISQQDDITSVPLNVGSLRLEAGGITRAAGSTAITSGDIKVFLTNEGGYKAVYERKYSYNSNHWDATDPICVDKRVGKVLGVRDQLNLITFRTNSTWTTTSLQVQKYNDAALWYYDNNDNKGGKSVSSANPDIAFNMKCAYARMSLEISRHLSYTSPCKVSGIVIKPSSGDFYTEAQVNITDGALTGNKVEDYQINTSQAPMNTAGIASGTTDTSIDLLFPPQKLTQGAGLTFILIVDNKIFSVTVPANTLGEIKAGVHYKVQLEMAGQKLSVGGVSITEWMPHAESTNTQLD